MGSSVSHFLGEHANTVTVTAVNLAAVLERADEQVLPSVYAYVARSFNASPALLGLLTLSRALAQALASPLGGIAGHCAHRGLVIGVGCLLWAGCAAAFTFTSSALTGLPMWALGGMGLALIIPSAQSLTADLHHDTDRGRAFGTMHLAASGGGMLGALFGTNVGAHTVCGVDGWRVVFFSIAALSALVGLLNIWVVHDPRFPKTTGPSAEVQQGGGRAAAIGAIPLPGDRREVLSTLRRELGAVLRVPTFLLIVAQGIFGSIPWSALVFLTVWLQMIGMSNSAASALVAVFLAGFAAGGLLGGCIGDAAAARWPYHGRILVAQFSVATGIPFSVLLFKGLPWDGRPPTIALYAATLLTFALLKAWPAPACNNPIFSQIVPPKNRTLIYAFDRCFETSLAACAAPLVGLLAQRVFGFDGAATPTGDRRKDLANAQALGNALLAFMLLPWIITLFLYGGLHWSYKRDREVALIVAEVQLSPTHSVESGGEERAQLLEGGRQQA